MEFMVLGACHFEKRWTKDIAEFEQSGLVESGSHSREVRQIAARAGGDAVKELLKVISWVHRTRRWSSVCELQVAREL